MAEQIYGARRCRDSKKLPLDQCVKVNFYHCEKCDTIFHETGLGLETKHLTCCEEETRLLSPISLKQAQALDSKVKLDYKIVGGYNDNTVEVYWNQSEVNVRPVWIYLKTFTGGYLKYLGKGKRAPMRYALADMDAFSYCDEAVCLECTFRCKRGFEIYVWIKQIGLVQMPLDKMSPYWESR